MKQDEQDAHPSATSFILENRMTELCKTHYPPVPSFLILLFILMKNDEKEILILVQQDVHPTHPISHPEK